VVVVDVVVVIVAVVVVVVVVVDVVDVVKTSWNTYVLWQARWLFRVMGAQKPPHDGTR
jgi:hypothetical protein